MEYLLSIEVAALAGLTAYLGGCFFVRWRARNRAEKAASLALEREYPARAFDTALIAPRVRGVRKEFSAIVRTRARLSFYRAGLLATARRFVAGLDYFRHPERRVGRCIAGSPHAGHRT